MLRASVGKELFLKLYPADLEDMIECGADVLSFVALSTLA